MFQAGREGEGGVVYYQGFIVNWEKKSYIYDGGELALQLDDGL